jgi:para-nitrobenzyl esterase
LAEAYGDQRMVCGALQDGESTATFTPTYVYEFADDPPADPSAFVRNYPPRHPLIDVGVTHSMDITYWLGLFQPTASPAQRTLGAQMRGYLVNFARTGDPNGPGLPRWEKYSAAGRRVMRLANPLDTSVDSYGRHQCDFWYAQRPSSGL